MEGAAFVDKSGFGTLNEWPRVQKAAMEAENALPLVALGPIECSRFVIFFQAAGEFVLVVGFVLGLELGLLAVAAMVVMRF